MSKLSLARLRRLSVEGKYTALYRTFQRQRRTIFPSLQSSRAYEEVLFILITALRRLGYGKTAHRFLSHAVRQNSTETLLLEYALSCLELKNVVKALSALDALRERGLSMETNMARLHGCQARILGLMGAFDTAGASLARATEYATSGTSEFLVVTQAVLDDLAGDWPGAESVLSDYLVDHPRSFDSLFYIAGIQARQGKTRESIRNYHRAREMRPEDFFPPYHLGYQYLQEGLNEEAGEAFQHALQLAPDNDYFSSIAWGLGFSLFQEEKWDKAIPWFRKAETEDMVKTCLRIQLSGIPERTSIELPLEVPLQDMEVDPCRLILDYFKIPVPEHPSIREWSLLDLRRELEANGLETLSFQGRTDRFISLLEMGVPVIVIISDFRGRRFGIIYSYNFLRELFKIIGIEKGDISTEELDRRTRSTDGWSLVTYPAGIREQVLALIPKEENERFRILEEAEADLLHGKVNLVRRRLDSLPPGPGQSLRLHMMHLLRKRIRPSSSPSPTLNLVLRATGETDADLGFAAWEYFSVGDYRGCLEVAGKALSRKIAGAPFLAAQAALHLGWISLALRYNARGLEQDPHDLDLVMQRGVCFRLKADYREASRFFSIAREIASNHPVLLREIGELYRIKNEVQLAEEYFRRSLNEDPHDPSTWESLVDLFIVTRRFRSAEMTCQQAMEQNPEEEWAVQLMIRLLIRQDSPDEAIDLAEDSLKRHPHSLSLKLVRLEILERMGQFDEAENGYRLLLEKQPGNNILRARLALLQTGVGSVEEAFRNFEKILKNDPDNVPALKGLAQWYALKNKLQLAFDLVKRVMSSGEIDFETLVFFYRLCPPLNAVQEGVNFLLSLSRDATRYTRAGYLYEITDQYDRALCLYTEALKQSGDSVSPLLRIAHIYHKRGDLPKSGEYYSKVLEKDPPNGEALEGLAYIQLEEGNTDSSLERLESMLRNEPESDYCYSLYLDFAEKTDRLDRARHFLPSLEALTEEPTRLLVFRGQLEERENSFDHASQLYRMALDRDEFDIPALYHMAVLEFKMRNFEQSLSLLERVLDTQPDYMEARFYRAVVLSKLGDREGALEECLQALESGEFEENLEIDVYDLLASLLGTRETKKRIKKGKFNSSLPDHFPCLLGEAFERLGDYETARYLYLSARPFDSTTGTFDAIIGLAFLAIKEEDESMLERIRKHLGRLMHSLETRPDLYNPLERSALHEAVAYISEGDRTMECLKEALKNWRVALSLTRTPWALERASYACLDLGEMTRDVSYFREALIYLRELKTPLDPPSILAPALGDAYYFLERYDEAVREYSEFFSYGEEDLSLQPAFFRFLDALEKTHSPLKDINELATRKLESLSPGNESASYRSALQERIFRNYMRTRQHRAALSTAIRSRGWFHGMIGYFRSVFHFRSFMK